VPRFGFWVGAAGLVLAASCRPEAPKWQPSPSVAVEQPLHFPPRAAWSAGAEPSEASVRLGELLFNDPALSADGQVSCASCHRREGAFSDPGMPVSVGVEGRLGRRNSPPIQNLAWTPYFMWDGGINHLEVLPLAPITNPAEHDLSLWDFVRRAELRYPNELWDAFGTDSATSQLVMRALAHYMMTLVSSNAPYDQIARGEREWTPAELQGKALFDAHCAGCHAGPLQTTWGFAYHGTPPTTPADSGRFKVSLRPEDMGLMRIPSLRNWAFTAPYLHDGRFATLEAVLVDMQQATGTAFSPTETSSLLAFLGSLNDSSYVD
jgi:cytochrome c peroxidase